MLRRYDLARKVCPRMQAELATSNGGPGWTFSLWPRKAALEQIIRAVLDTRPELNRRKIIRMAIAIFRARN
jgi:hypothetical protein